MKIIKYVFLDIIRNKILIAYTVFLLAISMGFFSLNDNPIKSISSLLNIVLIVLPLFSIIFASSYYYNSYEFTELLLAQPVKRKKLFISQYFGVSISLAVAFLLGCGIPVLLFAPNAAGLLLICGGITLTFVFVSLAFLASVFARDKAKGIGVALLLWFYFVFIYDALVLITMFALSDYPIEKFVLALAFFNPVDLIRIILLMQLDVAAIMGYTGAVFSNFLGSANGIISCFIAIGFWIIIPLLLSLRKFVKKDI